MKARKALGSALLVMPLLLAPSCSADGVTPDCPELPLYRVRDAAEREAQREALAAAALEGCTSSPQADGGAGSD